MAPEQAQVLKKRAPLFSPHLPVASTPRAIPFALPPGVVGLPGQHTFNTVVYPALLVGLQWSKVVVGVVSICLGIAKLTGHVEFQLMEGETDPDLGHSFHRAMCLGLIILGLHLLSRAYPPPALPKEHLMVRPPGDGESPSPVPVESSGTVGDQPRMTSSANPTDAKKRE
jgi:hypothetical protein